MAQSGEKVLLRNIENEILGSNVIEYTLKENSDSDFLYKNANTRITKNSDGQFCYSNYLNERVDEIYNTLKDNDSPALTYFYGEDDVKESIKKWIIAEFSTQYVNLLTDPQEVEKYKCDFSKNYIQGSVKVKRYEVEMDEEGNTKEDLEGKYITYVTRSEFKKLKNAYEHQEEQEVENPEEVFNHFTVDKDENIVVAVKTIDTYTSEYTSVDENGQVVLPTNVEYSAKCEDGTPKKEYKITEKKLPYREMVKPYTLPFNLLWAMVVYGRQPEFSNELAELVTNNEIIIGIRDNITTTEIKEVHKFLEEEKTHKKISLSVGINGYDLGDGNSSFTLGDNSSNFYWYKIKPANQIEERYMEGTDIDYPANQPKQTRITDIEPQNYFERTDTHINIKNSVFMQLEKIDSWFAKYELTYKPVHDESDLEAEEAEQPNGKYSEYEQIFSIYANVKEECEEIINAEGNEYIKNEADKLKNYILTNENALNQITQTKIIPELKQRLEEECNKYGIKGELYYKIFWSGLEDYNSFLETMNYDTLQGKIKISHIIQDYYDAVANESNPEDLDEAEVRNTSQEIFYNVMNELELWNLNNTKKQEYLSNEDIKPYYVGITEEKALRRVNQTVTVYTHIDSKKFQKESSKVTEKTEREVEDGETESFVSILSKSEYADECKALTGSISSWFLDAIQNNADTKDFVDLMKYLFYKVTNEDTGVTRYNITDILKLRMNLLNYDSMYSYGESVSGDYEVESSNGADGIYGTFIGSNGREYTLFYQNAANVNWIGKCNKSAAAAILTAYKRAEQSVWDIKRQVDDRSSDDPCSILVDLEETVRIFGEYGLDAVDHRETFDRAVMKEILSNGGYVSIHFTYNNPQYAHMKGKSGKTYNWGNMHWISILGLRVENGEEQIFVQNPAGGANNSGWVSIDDFEEYDAYINNWWTIMER